MTKNPEAILRGIAAYYAEVEHYIWNPQIILREEYEDRTEFILEFNSASKSPVQETLVRTKDGFYYWHAEPNMI